MARGNKRKYDYNSVFNYIVEYKETHDGNSPTLQEIASQFGISTTSVVRHILERLQADGLITMPASDSYASRNIFVVGGVWTMERAK